MSITYLPITENSLMQLFFREVGEGQPIIILHGVFGSSDNWLTISKVIADRGYRVMAADQRNHGRSPRADVHNYQSMAEDLNDFISEHQLENPVVIGHSMGGKTVMQFAMNYPDRFSKLVVVDIAPKFYPVHHLEILKGLKAIPLATLTNRNEADAILSQYEPSLAVRQFLLKNLYRNEAGLFDWRINLPVIDRNMPVIGENVTNLHPVPQPTLFMRGEKSNYVLDRDFDEIKRLFSTVTIDTIPDSGHWVQAEQPEAFVESLMGFLAS